MSHTADAPTPSSRRAWIGFVVATALLIVLAVLTLVRASRRQETT
jgi:hypothetical protein